MRRSRKALILALIIVQLTAITCINLNHLIQDYSDLNSPTTNKSLVKILLESITSSNVYQFYSSYTGTNSSFGFFAPNVGSEFTHTFTVLDSNLQVIGAHVGPNLRQYESNLRFNLCTVPIQDKLLDSTSIYNEYVKVMEHQISYHILNQYRSGNWVIARLYLCEYPSTEEYLNGDRRKLGEIVRYNFDFNDSEINE